MSDKEEITTVDARGYACPEPVMLARSALLRNKGKPVRVLVDTMTARDNVSRLAVREGLDSSSAEHDGGFAGTFRPKGA